VQKTSAVVENAVATVARMTPTLDAAGVASQAEASFESKWNTW
jgi:hypothetical protein